jgi:NitT/TauT family transport system permease protein
MRTRARTWTRRRRLVVGLLVAVLVVWLGGSELAAGTRVIDPFHFGPSAVWARSACGPPRARRRAAWGADPAHPGGGRDRLRHRRGRRVVAAIALGRIKILADVFAPYIKLANSIRASCSGRCLSWPSATA